MEYIYWIVMLDNISDFFKTISMFGLVFGTASTSLPYISYYEWHKKYFKLCLSVPILVFSVWVFSIIGAVFTPTTKQMIAIITIPKIVNNEQIQEMPDNALRLINQKLKEWAEETQILENPK